MLRVALGRPGRPRWKEGKVMRGDASRGKARALFGPISRLSEANTIHASAPF